MSIAHPWLEEEWPTKKLPMDMLLKKIERMLTITNIGYLGTVAKNGSPIVSPLEFYHHELSVYFFPQPNSPKLKAMRRDPRVAMAIRGSGSPEPSLGGSNITMSAALPSGSILSCSMLCSPSASAMSCNLPLSSPPAPSVNFLIWGSSRK